MGNKAAENEEILKMIGAGLLNVNNAPTQRLDVFTPGIYVRNLRMAANSVYLTEKHNTTHPYFLMHGKIHVWSEEKGWQLLQGPRMGITVPGTQRLFRTYDTEVIWATVHPTTIYPEDDTPEAHNKAVQLITDQIIQKVENPYLHKRAGKTLNSKKREGML